MTGRIIRSKRLLDEILLSIIFYSSILSIHFLFLRLDIIIPYSCFFLFSISPMLSYGRRNLLIFKYRLCISMYFSMHFLQTQSFFIWSLPLNSFPVIELFIKPQQNLLFSFLNLQNPWLTPFPWRWSLMDSSRFA